jgi:hypothetical protein
MDELDLSQASVAELGRLYRRILAELRRREVLRTGNPPVTTVETRPRGADQRIRHARRIDLAGEPAARPVHGPRSLHTREVAGSNPAAPMA